MIMLNSDIVRINLDDHTYDNQKILYIEGIPILRITVSGLLHREKLSDNQMADLMQHGFKFTNRNQIALGGVFKQGEHILETCYYDPVLQSVVPKSNDPVEALDNRLIRKFDEKTRLYTMVDDPEPGDTADAGSLE